MGERTVIVDVLLVDGTSETGRFETLRGNALRCLQAIEEEAEAVVRREYPVEGCVKSWQWYFAPTVESPATFSGDSQ